MMPDCSVARKAHYAPRSDPGAISHGEPHGGQRPLPEILVPDRQRSRRLVAQLLLRLLRRPPIDLPREIEKIKQ